MEPRGFPVRNRLRLLENRNMLIGLNQLPDKLLFVKYSLSLRASAHTGVAIPRLKGIRQRLPPKSPHYPTL